MDKPPRVIKNELVLLEIQYTRALQVLQEAKASFFEIVRNNRENGVFISPEEFANLKEDLKTKTEELLNIKEQIRLLRIVRDQAKHERNEEVARMMQTRLESQQWKREQEEKINRKLKRKYDISKEFTIHYRTAVKTLIQDEELLNAIHELAVHFFRNAVGTRKGV